MKLYFLALTRLSVFEFFEAVTLDTVRTFGSPRVGDLAFAEYYLLNVPDTQRMVHYKDPVPHIPYRVCSVLVLLLLPFK